MKRLDFTGFGLGALTALALMIGGCTGDDGTGTPGTLGIGEACAADADCAAGLECELEHGAGTCQPHGGDADGSTSASN